MIRYICKTCETSFNLPKEHKELSCPVCKGQTVLAADKPVQAEDLPLASNVLRCACGETRRELVNGEGFICVECRGIIKITPMIHMTFHPPGEG